MLLTTKALEQYAKDVARLLNEHEPVKAARAAKQLSARRIARILTDSEIEQPLPVFS